MPTIGLFIGKSPGLCKRPAEAEEEDSRLCSLQRENDIETRYFGERHSEYLIGPFVVLNV